MFRPRHFFICLAPPSDSVRTFFSSFPNFQTVQVSNLPTFLRTNPFRIRTYEKHARKPFRIRTSKTQHLKPFRMNTYKKTGGGEGAIHWRPPSQCTAPHPQFGSGGFPFENGQSATRSISKASFNCDNCGGPNSFPRRDTKKEVPSFRRTPPSLQGVEKPCYLGFAPACVLALCFLL